MRRGGFAYLGLIGSATKRARFTGQWRRQGVPEAAITRLACPIGIPGIAGKQPELIALSAAAELAMCFSTRDARHQPPAPADLAAECRACGASARCAGP